MVVQVEVVMGAEVLEVMERKGKGTTAAVAEVSLPIPIRAAAAAAPEQPAAMLLTRCTAAVAEMELTRPFQAVMCFTPVVVVVRLRFGDTPAPVVLAEEGQDAQQLRR